MTRGYKIGTRKVSQEAFDSEILRLVRLGLNQKEVARRCKASRWTIDRSMKRSVNRQPDQVTEAKTQGEYQKTSNDSFRGLPEIMKWIDNFKARGVDHRRSIDTLKQICDKLEIYPSMLDGHYAQKWLSMHAGILDKSQQRVFKVSMRGWLKFSMNASDNQLQVWGLDAKHYSVGKWATVGLSEEQIKNGIAELSKDPEDKKVLLAFRLGTECCMPFQELLKLKKSDFINEEKILRTYRQKTDSFWSKYPDQKTAYLLSEMITENVFVNGDFEFIKMRLRQIYHLIGATSPYFNSRPIHSLRHVGAQRLLRKTKWNRAVVAVLGGWNAEKTLEDHYGAVPNNIIHNIGNELWQEK